MNDLEKLIELMGNLIPEGTNEEIDTDEYKISLVKDGDNIKIQIVEKEEAFDDSEIKEVVSEFKEAIEELDDDLFVEIAEDFSTKLNNKEFNDLLNLESYTEEQAAKVSEMIEIATTIIRSHIQNKIQNLFEIYDKVSYSF